MGINVLNKQALPRLPRLRYNTPKINSKGLPMRHPCLLLLIFASLSHQSAFATPEPFAEHRVRQLKVPTGSTRSVSFSLYRFGQSQTETTIYVTPSAHAGVLNHLLDELHRDPALSQNKTIYCLQSDDSGALKTLLWFLPVDKVKIVRIDVGPSTLHYNPAGRDTAELMARLNHIPAKASALKPDSWDQAVGSRAMIRLGLPANQAKVWDQQKEALLAALRVTDSSAVPMNEYGLRVVTTMALYRQQWQQDHHKELVNLATFIPGIKLDLKYATTDNFMKRRLYSLPKAYLRRSAAETLKQINAELKTQQLGLKIFDAYRPYAVTKAMWNEIHDDTYVADPRHGSKHNRGCAVDLTLVDLKTGQDLLMTSEYGDLTPKAHHSYTQAAPIALQNRAKLKAIMEKYGFLPYESEWWHYNFKDWEKHDVLDLAFEWLP